MVNTELAPWPSVGLEAGVRETPRLTQPGRRNPTFKIPP